MEDFIYEEEEQPKQKRKARCRNCMWLNYDFFDKKYERDGEPFCGLHGRASVDPDGWQQNLDRRGGCGFHDKHQQLKLFDL